MREKAEASDEQTMHATNGFLARSNNLFGRTSLRSLSSNDEETMTGGRPKKDPKVDY